MIAPVRAPASISACRPVVHDTVAAPVAPADPWAIGRCVAARNDQGRTLAGMSGTDVSARDTAAEPFLGSQPQGMRADLVIADVWPRDEKLWVPLSDGVWSRPLHFNVTAGQYTHLMRVTRAGIIARHRHTGPVFAHILKGRWHYLEHDWVATEGGFVFEPPGETHTLVVPEGCQEMVTLFQVNGALVYVDQQGGALGYDDVFTRLEGARRHYASVGVDAGYLDTLTR
jgi:quercetin dioxygenase-like cupin family protein